MNAVVDQTVGRDASEQAASSVRITIAQICCGLILLAPLFSTPVLPLIDFYNHIARYYVLSHLDDPLLSANYAAAWALLPNLGLDVLATPLLSVVPPLLAAKLIAGFLLIVQFSGVIYLQRGLNRRADLLPAVLLVGLLYSYILTWGFSNFLLGLGLVFWNLGVWVRLCHRPLLAVPACAAGAVLIFLCHGFAFAVYFLLLACIELGRWWKGTERSVRALALVTSTVALQAVIPVLLFVQWWTATRGSSLIERVQAVQAAPGSLIERHDVSWHWLYTVFRVAESPFPTLDLVTFTLSIAVIGLALAKGWFRLHRWVWLALGLITLLWFVMPPRIFGISYLSDRLPLVFALVLVAGLASAAPRSRGAQVSLALLSLVSLIRIAAVTIGWGDFALQYADFQAIASVLPRGALVINLRTRDDDANRDSNIPRCDMYGPLTILLRGTVSPLYADPMQQPMRNKKPIEQALQNLPLPDGTQSYYDHALAQIVGDARINYVIVCERDLLTRPLPPGISIAARKGGIAILKVH
jgi:hypothetical protein